MADIDKLAQIIVNSNALLGKKLDSLTKAIAAKSSPIVRVAPPQVNLPPANITVTPAEVTIDTKGIEKLVKDLIKQDVKVTLDSKGLDHITDLLVHLVEVTSQPATKETNKEYLDTVGQIGGLGEFVDNLSDGFDDFLEKLEKSLKSNSGSRQGWGGVSTAPLVKSIESLEGVISTKAGQDGIIVAIGGITYHERLLIEILAELKKSNMYNEVLSDFKVEETDTKY